MTTQYEQFLGMLACVKQLHPRVYGSKNIKIAHDPNYNVVEMSSSAARILLGFSKKTGELRDIIGPMPLPRQAQQHQSCEGRGELGACALQATAGRG